MFSRKATGIFIISVLLIALWSNSCSAPKVSSNSQPVSHAIWDSLLRQYVDEYGLVNYQELAADSSQLHTYLELLKQNAPDTRTWSEAEQMAYWINAYNAFTLELIINHYPVAGIKEIKNGIPFVNTVWDIKFINIGGEEFGLNNIEHGILRKDFSDPRVHFALVCASMSCPKLQRFAFTAEQLDEQLDQAAREFLNEPYRNNIEGNPIRLSKILSWYWSDFKDKYDDRYALLEQYSTTEVNREVEIDFLDYDWSLNEQTEEKVGLLKGE
ncbi:MAG: DUF547 domain-containing protein [Bacteroidota bacterium]